MSDNGEEEGEGRFDVCNDCNGKVFGKKRGKKSLFFIYDFGFEVKVTSKKDKDDGD